MYEPHESVNAEVKAIISSVSYLENEASQAGFCELSLILRKTLHDIEQWLESCSLEQAFYDQNVVNSDLFKILKLLDRVAVIQRFDINTILAAIEAYDDNVRL